MKKLLSILGTVSLITSGSSNLISCNNNNILTSEELAKLKEENSKTINGNKLEWIAPQEKPFDTLDNKWYVVIWRGNENDNWNITKFQNNISKTIDPWKIEIIDKYELHRFNFIYTVGYDLAVYNKGYLRLATISRWYLDEGIYFKAVYRWDGQNEPLVIKINSDGEIEN